MRMKWELLVGWDYERMEGVHVSDSGYTCWIPTS
jgi:hypothetical protein